MDAGQLRVLRQSRDAQEAVLPGVLQKEHGRRSWPRRFNWHEGGKGAAMRHQFISEEQFKVIEQRVRRDAKGNGERGHGIRVTNHSVGDPASTAHVSLPQQRILDALAWLESVGVTRARRAQVAFLWKVLEPEDIVSPLEVLTLILFL